MNKEMKKEIAAIRRSLELWKTGRKSDEVTKDYAFELLDSLDEIADNDEDETCGVNLRTALNGASNWSQYSEGGCSLCYNYDIRKRLRTDPENPYANDGTTLLQWQAIKLSQAWNRIECCSKLYRLGILRY